MLLKTTKKNYTKALLNPCHLILCGLRIEILQTLRWAYETRLLNIARVIEEWMRTFQDISFLQMLLAIACLQYSWSNFTLYLCPMTVLSTCISKVEYIQHNSNLFFQLEKCTNRTNWLHLNLCNPHFNRNFEHKFFCSSCLQHWPLT